MEIVMKLNFNVDLSFNSGISRLASVLGYECAPSGITVTAEKSDKAGVALKDGKAVIYYNERSYFFRALGVLCENAKKSSEFEIFEDTHFTMRGVMLDTSNYHILSVTGAKRLLDYLAVMGYNMAMLYTEDTIKLDTRPYFGYMRGRYTKEELREIDDYAFDYGIEMIPCLECYGHMEKYLLWSEAAPIKDTSAVLLAREPKTFEFLEELFSTVSSCLRSKRIHIGMDEAHTMGKGKFLEKHGLVDNNTIFDEYMNELCDICKKYELTPMMWSDMYFRNNSERKWYYDVNVEIPEATRKRIPENIELVFWHYGEEPKCDNEMLKKHVELGRNTIFAAGTWCWAGHFPENNYAYETAEFSLNACRNNGVHEMMTTIWSKGDSDWFSNLLALSFTMELCYDKTPSKQKIKERFEATTGANYDFFMDMSLYHNYFDNPEEFEGGYKYHERFFGQVLFWQDILLGQYDNALYKRPMSAHYKAVFERMCKYPCEGRWAYLYDHAINVMEYLALKTEIAENIAPAYKNGDKEMLAKIAGSLLPRFYEAAKRTHESHREVWFRDNKAMNWAQIDIRYAGVRARAKSAIMLLNAYLDGEIEEIEELAEERLPRGFSGFMNYNRFATVTQHL